MLCCVKTSSFKIATKKYLDFTSAAVHFIVYPVGVLKGSESSLNPYNPSSEKHLEICGSRSGKESLHNVWFKLKCVHSDLKTVFLLSFLSDCIWLSSLKLCSVFAERLSRRS